MSTASQHCGSDRGPRAGDRNAVSVPGATGKTLGYYGPSAARQGKGNDRPPRRGHCSAEAVTTNVVLPTEREPDAPTAAPSSRAFTPISPISSGLREPRLRHSPPSFFPRRPPHPRHQQPDRRFTISPGGASHLAGGDLSMG